jgi:hypothetical protein
MKGASTLGVLLIVLATAVSVYIGARAIAGTTGSLGPFDWSTRAASDSLEGGRGEVAEIVNDLAAPDVEEPEADFDRGDPMTKYVPPPPPPEETVRARPRYKVTAVIIGDDPTAILKSSEGSIIVHVGDELGGGLVTAIEQDGVTVEGDDGVQEYPYPPE